MSNRPYVMESRFNTTCAECSKPIHKGDNITKRDIPGKGEKWVHLKCPKGKRTFKEMISGNGSDHIANAIDVETILPQLTTKVFIPSVYQQAIFDWVVDGTGNAIVEAVAGSGKTTTIVKSLELIPEHLRILFLAFNKHIVKELKRRVPSHIRVSTVHALGMSIIRKLPDFQDLDEDKISGIMDTFWSIRKSEVEDAGIRSKNRIKRQVMRKIVSLVKATLSDYNDPETILELIDLYNIEMDEQDEQEMIERLPEIMEINNSNLKYIDFDDMTYLPLIVPSLQNRFDEYDFILVDEAQDLNKAGMELIIKCISKEGRIIAVGDRRQSLYAFRGADAEAIPNLIKRLDAVVLPLSISYRCPKKHVLSVKSIVPQIEYAENAIEGILEGMPYKDLLKSLKEGDMVLCRSNAPLIKPAFECIRRGIKAIIKGKDIGRELVNFIERFQCDELGRLEIMMAEHTEREITRYIEKGKELQAEFIKDKFDTILTVAHECRTVEELTTKIALLFSDDNASIVFSSIHKAKGLEAQRIFILHPELMPHPKAKGDRELTQEANAQYVARTRSLSEMYIVTGGEE